MNITVKLELVGKPEEVSQVNQSLVERARQALEILVNKNTERGDCWRATGVLGGFVELHSIYNRLREMIWQRKMDLGDENWKKEFFNLTADIRNFTSLMEVAVDENLPYGDDSLEHLLKCKLCGGLGIEVVKQ